MAPHQMAVLGGHVVAQEGRALGEAHPGVLRDQVFQEEGHAGEWAIGERTPGRLAGQVVHGGDDGVEGRVQALNTLDGGVYQLDGLDFLAPDEAGLGGGVEIGEVAHGAGS